MSGIPELDYVLNPGRRVRTAFLRNMRVVEISEPLLQELIVAAETIDGRKRTVEWPEPDDDGFTTPIIHEVTSE